MQLYSNVRVLSVFQIRDILQAFSCKRLTHKGSTVLTLGAEDYEGSTSYVKLFSGSVAGDEQCVEVVIINDDYKEESETFTFAIYAGGDASVHIHDFYAIVYIIDEEGKTFVQLYWLVFLHMCCYICYSCTGLSVG